MKKHVWMLCAVAVSVSLVTGCSWTQRGALIGGALGAGIGAIAAAENHPAVGTAIGATAGAVAGIIIGDQLDQKHARDLERELANLRKELELKKGLEKENADLKARIKELEEKLRQRDAEIAELRKKLEAKVEGKGEIIICTLVTENHYQPGKAVLTPEGMKAIDNAVKIIKAQFPDREIVARGHTDSDPIKYSGWKTNWELGSARALGALHYLVDKHGIKGELISAQTFSKYRPVGDNATAEGKKANRRVEIVIMPKVEHKMEKVK